MVYKKVLLILMLSVAGQLPGFFGAEEDARKLEQIAFDRAVKRVLSDEFHADSRQLRAAVGQIEVQLAREIDLDEPECNLKRLIEILEGTEETSAVPVGRLDALQLLASLYNVWKGISKCNGESHIILSKNNEAIMRGVQLSRGKFPAHPTRMQSIFKKIALRHAEDCKLVYAQSYHRLLEELGADTNQLVKTFFGLIVDVHIRKSEPSWSLFGGSSPELEPNDVLDPQKIIKSFKTLHGPDEAETAYDFLKNYIQHDPDQWYLTRVPVSETDNRLVLDQTKIRQLFDRHLIEPCTKYVAKLGPEVFEPVEYEAQILENDDRHLNPDLIDFQKARIRYNLCKRLIRDDWKGLLNAIVGIAKQAPIHQFN